MVKIKTVAMILKILADFKIEFQKYYMVMRPWLVESSVIVPFCAITSMRDAVIINYQLFLY